MRTDPDAQSIALGLKEARLAAKPPRTQEAVATEAGLSQSTVARAENGQNDSLSTLAAIAAVLGREIRVVRKTAKRTPPRRGGSRTQRSR